VSLKLIPVLLAATSVSFASQLTFSLQDTVGKTHNSGDLRQSKATVFIFVGTDCPNSNTYAPLLARLYRDYSERGVAFYNVYSDPAETADTVRKHDADYLVPFPALLDPHQTLARQTGARSTPEAVMFAPDGQELYRGRVDDRFVDLGKTRFHPSEDTLREAIEAVLQGKPVPHPVTKVLGCAIPGLN
jgi:thiol-disulfide isomerase/thioredoxin